MQLVRFVSLATTLVAACADNAPTPAGDEGGDLPLGDRLDDDKADGNWGHALECKPIPDVPSLVQPHITISLDGLTLHLTDSATGYDRVFPIGPGRVDQGATDPEFRESLSYRPVIDTGRNDFVITPASSTPCKTWWTDRESGAKSPVFAGLPFMSWHGNYAIHGPIDNFRAANGGALRRGFVSHGCIRMEAADILEVYARVHGVAAVPVHVQREPERTAERATIDVPAKWIGAACSADGDCAYPNGFCAQNHTSHTGFCSARCTQYCSDRPGYPSTFCVADPDAAGHGMCVPKAQDQNFECRPYDHFAVATAQPRLNQPATTATVCLPRSPGWIGDHCLASSDCTNGTTCRGATPLAPGVCTMDCTAICPDQPGWADTFCAKVPALGAAASCIRRCTPSANGAECPTDMTCATTPRAAGGTRAGCVPAATQNL